MSASLPDQNDANGFFVEQSITDGSGSKVPPADTAFSGFLSRLGGCWADPGKLRTRDDLIVPRLRMTLSLTATNIKFSKKRLE
jgi:hypothetical protein